MKHFRHFFARYIKKAKKCFTYAQKVFRNVSSQTCDNSETEFRFASLAARPRYRAKTATPHKTHKEQTMPKKQNNKPTFCAVRTHDDDMIQLIDELAPRLGSRNAALCAALSIGMPILYAQIFGKEAKQMQAATNEKAQHNPNSARELKELRRVIDDVFVLFNVTEALLASLTNVKAAELNGEKVNAAQLLNGSMSALPEFVAGIKADLTTRRGGGDE